ncbi:DUF523 domain-containing protein [Dethiosulfatarculus sandiegensis]|uniref:Uncharacterized protein n=1 Tax=Dethiosulfatarculus sandiegensis TaxID=1429043 RepID=A0A0D2J641_9BACT|nr:DUF523 domain-containing protein [Dethiosulfatarculus sandiegensis]KIX13599.1 hypothetical protein X474_11180 [Dethiosulfatarculus sandiegensis]
MILVSACLAGQSVRYDGRKSHAPQLWEILKDKPFLALCPELLGGLAVPRPPARFEGAGEGQEGKDLLAGKARLVTPDGQDVSRAFIKGAELVVAAALRAGVTHCYLKDRSPSCGFDPFGKNPGKGPRQGVLTALLEEHGLEITEIRAPAWPR